MDQADAKKTTAITRDSLAGGKTTTAYGREDLSSAIDFDANTAIADLRAKQRRMERISVVLALMFVGGVVTAAIMSEGDIFSKTLTILQSVESEDGHASRNPAVNCMDSRNKNLPYCIERAAKNDANWRSIVRYQQGQSNSFTLHGK